MTLRQKKGSLTFVSVVLALRSLSLTSVAIFFKVPRVADTGLESTAMKAPWFATLGPAALGLGRKACNSKPFISSAVQSHCKAHSLPKILSTASSTLALAFGA